MTDAFDLNKSFKRHTPIAAVRYDEAGRPIKGHVVSVRSSTKRRVTAGVLGGVAGTLVAGPIGTAAGAYLGAAGTRYKNEFRKAPKKKVRKSMDINKALAGRLKAVASSANKMASLNPKVKSMGEMGTDTHNAMARLQGAKVKKNVFGVVDKRDLHETAQATGGDTHFARRTIAVKGKLQRLSTSTNTYSGPVHASSTKRVSAPEANNIPNRRAEDTRVAPSGGSNSDLKGVKQGARTKGDSPNYKHISKKKFFQNENSNIYRAPVERKAIKHDKKYQASSAANLLGNAAMIGGILTNKPVATLGGAAVAAPTAVYGAVRSHKVGNKARIEAGLKPRNSMGAVEKNAFGISKASVGARNGAGPESDGAKLGGHFRKTGGKAIKRTDKGDPLGKA